MTDSSLRSLERQASLDPAAEERLIVERIRAGGRDPRVDPAAGDVVYAEDQRQAVWRVGDGLVWRVDPASTAVDPSRRCERWSGSQRCLMDRDHCEPWRHTFQPVCLPLALTAWRRLTATGRVLRVGV